MPSPLRNLPEPDFLLRSGTKTRLGKGLEEHSKYKTPKESLKQIRNLMGTTTHTASCQQPLLMFV